MIITSAFETVWMTLQEARRVNQVRKQERRKSEQLKALLHGESVDVVADVVAGPLFKDLINLLRPEGRYTTAGAFAGPVVELDLRTLYLKHLEIHGSSQGTRQAFARLVGYIESGKISANLFATYRLSDFHQAQTDFMGKGYVGKLVVMPDRFYQPVESSTTG